MKAFILLLLTLCYSFTNSFRSLDESGLVSIPFSTVTEKNYLIAPISIGTPEQNLNLVLDIGSERTWIYMEEYTRQSSTSYVDIEYPPESLTQDEFAYSGTLSNETFKIGEKEVNDFTFLLADKITGSTDIKGALSLGREYDSKKFSMVYRLTASAGTFFNAFSLKFNEDDNKGTLYIGDLSSELQKETQYMDVCKLANNEQKIKWSCTLTHLFIGDLGTNVEELKEEKDKMYVIEEKSSRVFEVNKIATFETVFNKILFPFSEGKQYLQYLEDNYFINEKGEKLCKSINDENQISFECNKTEVEQLKNLNFVFDGKLDLYLKATDLFNCFGDYCYFLIGTNKNVDRFVMGVSLLRKFHTVFDYTSEDLTFHSHTNKAKVRINSGMSGFSKFMIFLLVVGLIALIGGAGYYFFVRRKKLLRKQIETQIYEKF